MRRFTALALAAAMPLSMFVVAADGDDACRPFELEYKDEVVETETCELPVWFTDARPGLGNLAETGLVSRPTWSTDAPTGSYQAGEGYGTLGSPVPYVADTTNNSGSAVFVGSFEGAIETMSVTIHGSHFGYAGTADPVTRRPLSLNVAVNIDGVAVLPTYLIEDVPLEAAPNATGLDQYRVTVTNLVKGMLRGKLDLGADHEVELILTPNYVNTGAYAFFVYGASEVDGGIVFNPAEIAEDAMVVKA